MQYMAEIQDTIVRDKIKAVLYGIADMLADSDEALDIRQRDPEEYTPNHYELVGVADLSFYWSSGTGTPMQDKLIERLISDQAAEWARQFPNRAPMLAILASDDSEFRDEAQKWESAALDDEAIYLRIEVVRADGDIKFSSCFTDEVNRPYGEEYVNEMDEVTFLTMFGDDLEKFARELADAPYKATI